MDIDELRALIRAAVLAAPLTACGAATANTESPPGPTPARSETTEPETTPARDETTQPDSARAEAAEARPDGGTADGTMDGDEFDRRWREHLRTQPHAAGTAPRRPPREIIMPGRPFATTEGPATVAALVESQGWGEYAERTREPEIAARWLEAAQAEHASVASFARAVLELTAVGAPADLLADHLRAGVDEVEHARACFELAARYGATDLAPRPLAAATARQARLDRLAVDTFIEGCVNETAAALAAGRAAAGCSVPRTRAALEWIADDEARHAALAWRTVRWALESDPARVAPALRAVPLPRPEGIASGRSLRAHGLLDDAELAQTVRDAVERVVRPMRAELLRESHS